MKRAAAAFLFATLATLVTTATPAAGWLAGVSFDVMLAARALIDTEAAPEQSPSVVIAIDEETYRRAPFAGTPKAAWPQYLGTVYAGVLDAGAVVIGQDVVLPTSLETLAPGVDKPYLETLLRYGRVNGQIVLGAVRHQGDVIGPHPSHRLVVGGDPNIRLLNLRTDTDGVAREAPLKFGAGSEAPVTSFAAELATRAGWDGTANARHYNFRHDPTTMPVYSLADILACIEADDTAFLEQAFAGRIVLVGAVLDIEDRKLTSARYLGRKDNDHFAPRCVHPPLETLYQDTVARTTIPGVFTHAQAVNGLLQNDMLDVPTPFLAGAGIWVVSLIAALAGLFLRPLAAVAGQIGLVIAAIATSTLMLGANLVLPLLPAVLAAFGTGALAYVYRFAIADRDKRMIRQSFAKYLSPAVVDELVETGQTPKPGGETREVTIWFSDLAGFTKMSAAMTPAELVSELNAYLTVMTGAITEHRGMIDKYIGDAVVGVFGAPLDDPDHAKNALAAARACQAALDEFRAGRPGWPATRVGINTGRAVVGNIGSDLRLDYTVMGDAVNLAARLESLNKRYGTTLLVSETTIDAAGDTTLRPLDRVQVVGRSVPTKVFSQRDELSAPVLKAYQNGLDALSGGELHQAAAVFSSIANDDPVAARMADFSNTAADNLQSVWQGYFVLDKK